MPPPAPAIAVALAVALAAVAPGIARADRPVARARVDQGLGLLAIADRAGALARFEDAMAADADYLPAYDAAIELWIEAGDWRGLVVRLSRLTLRHPDYVAGWYALAFAYRKLGRADLAIACYEAYVGMRPLDPDPHYGLAMAALESGARARAAAALARYLELEDRPERGAFVARARAELSALGGDGGDGGDRAGAGRRLVAEASRAAADVRMAAGRAATRLCRAFSPR